MSASSRVRRSTEAPNRASPSSGLVLPVTTSLADDQGLAGHLGRFRQLHQVEQRGGKVGKPAVRERFGGPGPTAMQAALETYRQAAHHFDARATERAARQQLSEQDRRQRFAALMETR